MFTKTVKIGLVAVLGITGVVTAGEIMAGTPQVIATIQTGPEWEPLPRGERYKESMHVRVVITKEVRQPDSSGI
ncbi:hypothetical protein [Candidatus Jettenia sp. AMX1]|uniref:hypothetical protein n=1 Tax=Candidatus Jettenia sp. AMX1 TaxID=2293637 RepID=UPI0025534CEC|nr:hypothetical protein [Candidatus Jettenia sp. AMX1]